MCIRDRLKGAPPPTRDKAQAEAARGMASEDKAMASEAAMRLVSWTKHVMATQLLCTPDSAVCDICCSDNLEQALLFWTEGHGGVPHPGLVVMTCDSADRSAALQAAYDAHGQPAHVKLVGYDENEGIWGTLNRCARPRGQGGKLEGFQAVCCLNGLGSLYESHTAAMRFTQSAVQLLAPGGYLLGVAADSAEIWSKAVNDKREFVNRHVKRSLFEFDIGLHQQEFGVYGTSVRAWLRGQHHQGLVVLQESLAHFPSMIDNCQNLGLEMMDIVNVHSFYETYRKHRPSIAVLARLKSELRSQLTAQQAELLALFTTFLFRRTDIHA
eukprot:TRINITY_DN44970_c0_g1_i1.p1 TRINITY_DN44970_c0_g1~~TRINITY_DN44970_c0_g1_i1.p1  ORF type:complete len:326 (-),score=72.61 TRINITY_DN44970_c0_g1_i1:235-1212(-)